MNSINVTTPIIAVTFSGNCKERLTTWKYTFLASYEPPFDLTVCLVKTGVLNSLERRKSLREIEKQLRRMNLIPASLTYYKNGADVETIWSKQNLLS
jgi:hypothetical protein